MRTPRAPRLDERRAPEFSAELRERARAWIPSWGLADGERDFGRALLEVAARFSSEVAERLDDAGEKMRRGFLDWLGVRGEAARPARVPVVFKLADTAREGVLASAPVRMQADAGGTSVVLETEKDVRVVPGRLQVVVGVDADADAFYLPPPGLSDLEPLEPLPTQWQLKSFAAAGAIKLQLNPELGLAAEMMVEAAGQQYRIVQVDKEIVTIEPPLTKELPGQTIVRKVTSFAPFDGPARNRQEHALYLGHMELLDIESAATIAIVDAQALRESVAWQYWGKVDLKEDVGWQPLALDKTQQVDAVVLTKPEGAIIPREVGGKSSRWIRAFNRNVPAGQQPFQPDELAIRINPLQCSDPDLLPSGEDTPSPAAEGMANTMPLVLDSVFYPLGREPRQFDAFYLGSPEAFSKPGAQVQLHFNMADPSFESLTCLRIGPLAHVFFAGVAGDDHLYLLRSSPSSGTLTRDERGPLRPPSPGKDGAIVAAPPIPLDPRPKYRAAMWPSGSDLLIAVAAAGAAWIWRDAGQKSGWESLGDVGPVADSKEQIVALVHLTDGNFGQLFALRENKLFVRDLNDTGTGWRLMSTEDSGGNPIALQTIVPIAVQDAIGGVGPGTLTNGLAGVDADKLYEVTFSTSDPTKATCKKRIDDVVPEVAPAAVRRSDGELLLVGLGKDQPPKRLLLAWLSGPGTPQTDQVELEAIGPIGHSIDVNVLDGLLTFVLCLQDVPLSTALAFWTPFFSPLQSPLIVTPVPAELGAAGGSPTLLPAYVLVPATSSQVLVAVLESGGLFTKQTKLRTAVIASTATDQLQPGDKVAIPTDNGSTKYQPETAPNSAITLGTETLYEFNVASVDDDLFVYRVAATTFTGTVIPSALDTLTPDPADTDTPMTSDTILLITTDASMELYEAAFDPGTGNVLLDRPLNVTYPLNPPLTVAYQVPEISHARLAPLLRLLPASSGDWQASLLGRTYLTFPSAEPGRQHGKAFQVDPNGKPELVALGEHWTTAPPDTGSGAEFLVDGRVREWKAQLGDTSTNPALSWEYANGTGWWKLDPLHDETMNLKRSGNVRFTIPADLRPMDWAGRTNYWIRARLVGGDYGREKVTVKSKNLEGGVTEQTVERSSEGIRAPSVVRLHIAYRVCEGLLPTFVLAQDSGSLRDQSDANRTAGAIVEAFVPVAVTLGRLSDPAAAPEAPDECPPLCQCPSEPAAATVTPVPAAPPATGAPRLATGRALFIGLDAALAESPVNVLLLVEAEPGHEQFAPMRIEALVANRFVPVVADDATRALGESGLLSMAFALEPTPRELFGMDNLTWLRLTPGGSGPVGEWKPTLRGAYLNAVWASAAETLTRELLGSSEGAPDLTVHLARPPVLRDSLELRVKEPLGEEERDELLKDDETRVLSAVDGLTGDWVLWQPVIDPGDEPATARVYALDEANGEIRFGDGKHGAIPPIGRDSIVAFSYRRTELGTSESADVPANTIAARTALNLVSPVESVEAVFAADQAAGGAPPETVERVLRSGTARQRHRNRAVTAHDFEDLALQSSPDVVQARCLVRSGQVRLVVVMRGEDPRPNAAEVRELRRLLLAAAPTSLSASRALRITGPRMRRLRVVLKLRVASLDDTGEVSRTVKGRITALLDSATGGVDRDGWMLGEEPSEEDIALALLDTRRLEGLARVTFREVRPDGAERPWTGAVKRDELVMLDEDAVRLEFEIVGVVA